MAYPFVAAIAGGLTRLLAARTPRFLAATIGCTAAVALLFASGAGWLMHVAHLSSHAVWVAAIVPFLPGEAIKICIAAGTFRALSRSRASH
jgi:biotin transport system substrate-specific component